VYLFHKDKLKTSITTSTPHTTCGKVFGQNHLKSRIWAVGFSTMTSSCSLCITCVCVCMCVWISGKEHNHCHSTPFPRSQIYCHWTCFFSQYSILYSREGDSMISPWMKQNFTMHMPSFKWCTSLIASDSIVIARRTVWSPSDTVVKGTILFRMQLLLRVNKLQSRSYLSHYIRVQCCFISYTELLLPIRNVFINERNEVLISSCPVTSFKKCFYMS